MSIKLLFVCSGNICRSPMALVLARHEAQRIGLEVLCDSAGTLRLQDRLADPHAVTVCSEWGLHLADHRSKGVTAELIDWADHILVMSPHHSESLAKDFPHSQNRVILLGHLVGQLDIADPIGRRQRTFRQSRDLIQRGVTEFLRRLDPK
jgi:protein-tyrosine-phosphatase